MAVAFQAFLKHPVSREGRERNRPLIIPTGWTGKNEYYFPFTTFYNGYKHIDNTFLCGRLDRMHISSHLSEEFIYHGFDIKNGSINQSFNVIFKIFNIPHTL